MGYVDVVGGRRRPPPPSPLNTPRPPFVELQPDEVRQLAPLPTPEQQKCGEAIPPESITRTRHGPLASVTIFVKSAYKTREEADGLHQFIYTVEIANDGEAPLQLMARHWVFTDERGHVEEVKGPGARGQMANPTPNPNPNPSPNPSPSPSPNPTLSLSLSLRLTQVRAARWR